MVSNCLQFQRPLCCYLFRLFLVSSHVTYISNSTQKSTPVMMTTVPVETTTTTTTTLKRQHTFTPSFLSTIILYSTSLIFSKTMYCTKMPPMYSDVSNSETDCSNKRTSVRNQDKFYISTCPNFKFERYF